MAPPPWSPPPRSCWGEGPSPTTATTTAALTAIADLGPPATVVVFGASGDLARRKVFPALSRIAAGGRPVRLVGAGRSDLSDESFQELVRAAAPDDGLAAGARWVRVEYGDATTYGGLLEAVAGSPQVVFYLATPPSAFDPILSGLSQSGLAGHGELGRRIVIEKPLGSDRESAARLNRRLGELLDEAQIYRLDHYLAKDTVQNVLAFRFSNSLFEPIWSRTMIQTIQITAAEAVDIGSRAGYYDGIGAVRDMIQNHVLQVLALVAMEPPTTFNPEDIQKAKFELLRAVRPLSPATAVRGQYDGYLQEAGVPQSSRRETYAAVRIAIENWRWQGVPIFVRTGKALCRQLTEVVIRLKDAPQLSIDGYSQATIPTLIVIRIQPDEGISVRIGAKRPGSRFEMVPAGMRLGYRELAGADHFPDAYQNVLSEVLAGAHGVFPSGPEIERSWEIVEPLINSWEAGGYPEPYRRGSWGPPGAEELVATTAGGRWIVSGDEPGT